MKRKKRQRMSSEDIKKKSVQKQGGVESWFRLPDGVRVWTPTKKGVYKLDFLPYEVTTENHPNEIAPGIVWKQYPFKVHHSVGPDKKSFICPTTIGKKCPICEEIARLSKDYDANEDIIKTLRPQRYMAYNIVDPDDEEKVAILAMSVGKFSNLLDKELEESDEDIANFFDVTEDGRTVRVRFSDAEYGGRQYLEATKIDFLEREAMDEDEIFNKTVNLDEIFVVPDYEKLASLFQQDDDGDDDEDDEVPVKKSKEKPVQKKAKPPVDNDNEDDDDDDDEDDEPPVKAKAKAKAKAPVKTPVDDDEWDDDDNEDDEVPVKKSKEKTKPAPKKAKPPVDDDDDDWDDDDDDWDDDDD